MESNTSGDSMLVAATRALRRHKIKSLVFFLAVMAAVLAWNALGSKKYRSEGKLLVRSGRENSALDPTVTLGHDQVMSVPSYRDNELNSVVEVINSYSLAEKIVDALGPRVILESGSPGVSAGEEEMKSKDRSEWKDVLLSTVTNPDPNERQRAIRRVTTSLDASTVPRSNVIRVTYLAGSPQTSQAILSKLMDLFLEEHVRLQRPAGGEDFLESQTAQMHADLDKTEEAIRRMKSETEIVSPQDRRAIVVKRVGTLEDEALQTASDLAVAEAAANGLREKMATIPPTEIVGETQGISDGGMNLMRDRYYALQIAEKEARAKLNENHPRMQEIIKQEKEAREILDHQEATRPQVTKAPSKAYEQLRLELMDREVALASLKTKADVLAGQLAEARRALQHFSDQEIRLAQLDREREIQEARYRKYSSVTEEARVDKALQAQRMSNISVVQPASCDPTLVLPRKSLNLAAGMVVGLLGAIGIALIAESRSPRPSVGRGPLPIRDQAAREPAGNGASPAHVPAEGRRITVVNAP
jgi:polysaccharide biosynthesis protein PslE